MRWWIVKKRETDDIIEIAFSYEDGNPDGIVIYNKRANELTVTKAPDNCSKIIAKKVCQYIWGLMRTGKLTEKGYWIITG